MPKIQISVIIPVYNGERYIASAVESVLQQMRPIDEIIVVDDGSTDCTEARLAPYRDRILYLKQKNGGAAQARNAGLLRATGDFITFLDADDVWLPEKTKIQLDVFNEHPQVDLVYTQFENVSDDLSTHIGIQPSNLYSGMIFEQLLVENFIGLPTVMLRRRAVKRVGLFNEQLRTAEDTNYFLRVTKGGGAIGLETVTVLRRIHPHNLSKRTDIKVGTLENLDHIVSLFPEFRTSHSPTMLRAYTVRGINLLKECFNQGAYVSCRKYAKELQQRGVKNRLVSCLGLACWFPAPVIDRLRALRRLFATHHVITTNK